jgi:PilZ domain
MGVSPEVVEAEPPVHARRRRHPRYALRSLAYVNLDQANGGIIRDLGESGMAVQAIVPFEPNQLLNLRFDLLAPRVRIESRGQVCWADRSGQGGIQFCGLTPKTRNALKDWLLTQMLSAAAISGRDSIFASADEHLMLSSAPRAPIMLTPRSEEGELPPVRWGWFLLSPRNFSLFVDALVIACAILLFSVAALAEMGSMPAWPLAAALGLSSSTIFIAVYQLIFSDLLCGDSPGKRLAWLAVRQNEEEPARFR